MSWHGDLSIRSRSPAPVKISWKIDYIDFPCHFILKWIRIQIRIIAIQMVGN